MNVITKKRFIPFTLVELLVVIAIISMLMCILMPALSRAKDMGKFSSCTNNLKQIGTAIQCYTTDYNDHYPLYSYGTLQTGGGYWTVYLVRTCKYIPGKTFVCPKRNSTYSQMYKWQNALAYPLTDTEFWGYPDYGYNYSNFGCGVNPVNWSWSARIHQVKRPSTTILAAESARSTDRTMGGTYVERYTAIGPHVPWPTHDGVCNILWADTHVSGVKGGNGANEASAAALRTHSQMENAWSL